MNAPTPAIVLTDDQQTLLRELEDSCAARRRGIERHTLTRFMRALRACRDVDVPQEAIRRAVSLGHRRSERERTRDLEQLVEAQRP